MTESTRDSPSFTETSGSEGLFPDVSSHLPAGRLAIFRSVTLPAHEENCFLRASRDPRAQAVVEAYHRLRTSLVTNRELSTLVVSGAGAEGKTLTVFNLALCFANLQSLPVLLVDADLRTKGLSQLLGLQASAGLAEILATGLRYEDAVVSAGCENLHVLPAGLISSQPPELFSRAAWTRLIAWSSTHFKLVLIDSPPVLRFADFDLIAAACENVLLVVHERQTDRQLLASACAHVDPGKLVGVAYIGIG